MPIQIRGAVAVLALGCVLGCGEESSPMAAGMGEATEGAEEPEDDRGSTEQEPGDPEEPDDPDDPGEPEDEPVPDTDDDPEEPPGAGESSDGPTIVLLRTNMNIVGEDDLLRVSAIVTDPDGVDDVIGGVLETPDGESVLGTFSTGAQEGAYELQLSFDELMSSSGTIGTTPVALRLRATFFDQQSYSTSEILDLEMVCASGFACGGGRCRLAAAGPANVTDAECSPWDPTSCPLGETCDAADGARGPNYQCVAAGSLEYGAACEVGQCSPGLICLGSCASACKVGELCSNGLECETLFGYDLCGDEGVCF